MLYVPSPTQTFQSGVKVDRTGSTSEGVIVSVTIPPLRPNDSVTIFSLWSFTNNANSKTAGIRLNGVAGTSIRTISGLTTQQSYMDHAGFVNRNSSSSQISQAAGIGAGGWASGNAAVTTPAVDFSTAKTIDFTGLLGTGTDTISLEYYQIILMRG